MENLSIPRISPREIIETCMGKTVRVLTALIIAKALSSMIAGAQTLDV